MEFTAPAADSSSYEKPKPGSYYGVLIGFAELGTQHSTFGPKKKVMLRWELHRRKGPALDSQGCIMTAIARYSQSFHEKSSLRKVIQAHVGPIAEGAHFRSQDWLGKAARLVLEQSGDGDYVNVESVTPLDPEEDPVPERQEALVHWEFKDGTAPPNWCKPSVERSAEWEARNGNQDSRRPVAAGASARARSRANDDDDDDDDDIPF